MSSKLNADQVENNKYLKLVMMTVRLLSKQGLAFRGKTDDDSNFNNVLETLIEVAGEKCNLQEDKKHASPDMQNEMMQIFHDDVMRNVVKKHMQMNFSAFWQTKERIQAMQSCFL